MRGGGNIDGMSNSGGNMSTQKGNLMRNDSAGRQGPGSSFEGREGDFKGKQPHHPHAHQPFTELSYKPPERT